MSPSLPLESIEGGSIYVIQVITSVNPPEIIPLVIINVSYKNLEIILLVRHA